MPLIRGSLMTTGKQLAEFAACSVAMAASLGLCIFLLSQPLRFDPGRVLGVIRQVSVPEQQPMDFGIAVKSVPLVTKMQGALIKKGYSIGPDGANGKFNRNTLTALQVFQDNSALPVQPKCDQQCWTSLGLTVP